MTQSRSASGRIFWGLILIGLGVLFLMDQMGELDFGEMASRYWPVVFIVIGLSILISNGFRNAGAGVFFILFGAFFLLMRLDIFSHSLWHYWPVFVIGAGVWMLVKPAFRPRGSEDKKKTPELSTDELKVSAVMAGLKRRIDNPAFQGGKAEVVMGSLEIDLTGAIPAGGQAVVYLSVVMGEIELRVPRGWAVVIEGTPVLGSVEDKRSPAPESEKKASLRLVTSVIMGSIEIKD